MTKKTDLLLRQLEQKSTNDQYVRENFRRIQEYMRDNEATGDTLVTQINNIVSGATTPDTAKLIVTKKASVTISALQLVYLVSNTHVGIADKGTFAGSLVLGIALNGGSPGVDIRVQTYGVVEDPFFSYTLSDILFLDTSGAITNTAPTTDHSVQIGQSLGTGAIFINIERPIVLS